MVTHVSADFACANWLMMTALEFSKVFLECPPRTTETAATSLEAALSGANVTGLLTRSRQCGVRHGSRPVGWPLSDTRLYHAPESPPVDPPHHLRDCRKAADERCCSCNPRRWRRPLRRARVLHLRTSVLSAYWPVLTPPHHLTSWMPCFLRATTTVNSRAPHILFALLILS